MRGFASRGVATGDGVAGALGQLGDNHVVGSAKERREFLGSEGFFRFKRDPLGARKIRRGDDAGALGQFGEGFVGSLKGQPDGGGNQYGMREHFASDLEGQVVFPDLFLAGLRERQAEVANPIDIHAKSFPSGLVISHLPRLGHPRLR